MISLDVEITKKLHRKAIAEGRLEEAAEYAKRIQSRERQARRLMKATKEAKPSGDGE